MDEMLVGLRDVDEHSGEKFERVDRLGVADIVSGLGLINRVGDSNLTQAIG